MVHVRNIRGFTGTIFGPSKLTSMQKKQITSPTLFLEHRRINLLKGWNTNQVLTSNSQPSPRKTCSTRWATFEKSAPCNQLSAGLPNDVHHLVGRDLLIIPCPDSAKIRCFNLTLQGIGAKHHGSLRHNRGHVITKRHWKRLGISSIWSHLSHLVPQMVPRSARIT